MKKYYSFLLIFAISISNANGQSITFSELENNNNKNSTLEVIGKISGNILVYKNINNSHKILVYNNDMSSKETVKLNYISERTTNIDFIPQQNYFLMLWQFQKRNIIYCNAVKIDGDGKQIGEILTVDTTKIGAFSNNVYYNVRWSEDKKKTLIYKTSTKNNDYLLATKVLNENLIPLDSARYEIDINRYKESIGDLQIDNNGGIVFAKLNEGNSEDYINDVEVFYKKINDVKLHNIKLNLEKQKIKDPSLKIDNYSDNIFLNAFAYRKNIGTINGLFTAIINKQTDSITKKNVNLFSDTLLKILSGKPDWKSAFDNFFFKNTILKKDGGLIIITEEYYTERRFGNNSINRIGGNGFGFDNSYGGFYNDYYNYNRGNYGYYRPYNSNTPRDLVYNYDDILIFSLNKDLKLEWNNVINKSTSDIDTDNYLSFANMNTGGELYFLFFQKDNRQILSNHSLKPDGNITRHPTLKTRDAGYEFMPKLGRQTGSQQIVIPCTIRGNIAFAKIDF